MWLFYWLLSAQVVTAADDAEFAFNLFSDIAPILALFGDQFAKQFMSESLTWYDHIIFAMVPLGIVTTVVGAIRVQGSARLRAFIGYARENKAFAEIELMSSTSHEVGEIFNGKSIVRVMGRPEIRQLLIYPDGYQGYRKDNAKSPNIIPETSYYHTVETIKSIESLHPKESEPTNPSMESSHQIQDNSQLESSNVGNASSILPSIFLRRPQIKTDEEAPENTADPSPPQKTLAKYNETSKTFESPNLQLNISSEEYHDGGNSGSYRLKIGSLIAVVLQLGLIAIAGSVEYRVSNKGSDLLESKKYGFPCYTVGSFLLCMGMGLCSWIIEHSTTEETWRAGSDSKDKECIPQLVWLQQAQKVNDQYFDGYIIFAGRKSRVIKSRRWNPETSPDSRKKEEIITTQELKPSSPPIASFQRPSPSSAVAILQPRDAGSDTQQTEIPENASRKRLASLIHSFYEKLKPRRWEVITLAAGISAALGFILQFMGLRGLSFPSSIAQLIAILVMAGVRAWVRKGLGKEIHCLSVAKGYELESFSMWLFKNQLDLLRDDGYKEGPVRNPPGHSFQWSIMTPDIKTPTKNSDIKNPDIESPAVFDNRQGSADLIKIRKRLGELCKWRSKAFNSAQCLARCVELFMNEFFLSTGSVREGLWETSYVRQGVDGKEGPVFGQFSIPLRRSTPDKATQRLWKVDDEIVEATLSLWMASIVAKKKEKDEKSGDWRSTKAGDDLKYTFRRIIGGNSKDLVLQRDISWWVGDVITDQGDICNNTDVAVTGSTKPSRTSDVPEITIGLNGRGRDYENTANELSITKDADLPIILAQHLFTRFMWAVVDQWSLVRSLGPQLQSEHVKVEGLRAFDGFNFEQTWQQPKLSHPTLTRLASKMESLGLGSAPDVLLCIIPALSSQNLLPNNILLTRVPPIDRNQAGMNLLKCYTELLHKVAPFKKKDKLRSSVIIHAIDFLYQAFHVYDRFNRLSFDLSRGFRGLAQILISISRREKRFFTRLSQVYRVQKRLDTFVKVFRHFGASDQEMDRLGFGRMRPTKQKSFNSFALKYLNFSEDHVFYSFYRESEPSMLDFPDCPSGQIGYKQKSLTEDQKKEQSKNAKSRSESLDVARAKKRDIFGWTPLHYACATGHGHVLLLDDNRIRAELPRLIESFMRTPFHIAAACMDNAFGKLCLGFSNKEEFKEAFLAVDRIGQTTFHLIAQAENESAVTTFFSAFRNALVRNAITVKDTFGRQPLHVAAKYGRTTTVKMLMEKESCDINARDENGRTALQLAITAGHTETAIVLLRESKCRINAADEDGQTILQTAILAEQVTIVKLLVDRDCDINAKDEDGRTALHLALKTGQATITLLLIDGTNKRNVKLLAKDKSGVTALMYAAHGISSPPEEAQGKILAEGVESNNKVPSLSPVSRLIFDYLIEKCPDTEEVDSDKETALHHAISASNEAAALYLLDRPINEKTETIYNAANSILIRACKQTSGFGMIVTKILARFPRLVNQPDSLWKQPPISWACEYGNDSIVAALLNYKPFDDNEPLDINQQSPECFDWTPLHFAVDKDNEKCLTLLFRHPAIKLDIKNWFGHTPLHNAVARGSHKCLSLLLDHPHVKIDAENTEAGTLLDVAIQRSRADMAQMLVANANFPDHERIRQLKNLAGCSPNGFGGLVEHILNSFRSESQLNGCLLDLVQISSNKLPTEVSNFIEASLLKDEAQELQYPFHRAVILGDPRIFNHVQNMSNISDHADQVDQDNWLYQDYAISLGRDKFAKVVPKRTCQYLVPRKMDWGVYHENVQVTTCNGHSGNECGYITDVTVAKAHHTLTRACIRSHHPIPPIQGHPRCFYFEVEVIENSDSKNVAIGFCGNDAQLGMMPGWFEPSWALHGDDGLLFINSGHRSLKPSNDFGDHSRWNNGDVIGVQLNMDTGVGICTRNGRILNMGDVFGKYVNNFRRGKMYPCVGFDLRKEGINLKFAVNLEGSPAHPFKYQGSLPIQI